MGKSLANGFQRRIMEFDPIHAGITGYIGTTLCYVVALAGIWTTQLGFAFVFITYLNPYASDVYQLIFHLGGIALGTLDVFMLYAWFFQGSSFYARLFALTKDPQSDKQTLEFFDIIFKIVVICVTIIELATNVTGLYSLEWAGIQADASGTKFLVAMIANVVVSVAMLFFGLIGTIIGFHLIGHAHGRYGHAGSHLPATKASVQVSESKSHTALPAPAKASLPQTEEIDLDGVIVKAPRMDRLGR